MVSEQNKSYMNMHYTKDNIFQHTNHTYKKIKKKGGSHICLLQTSKSYMNPSFDTLLPPTSELTLFLGSTLNVNVTYRM
jgi:hypothetical protein